MNVIEIEPIVANNIVQIEKIDGGQVVDGAIYLSANDGAIRLSRFATPVPFNFNSMNASWKAQYQAAYDAWVAGDPASGVPPGDPNGFFIDTYVMLLGDWKMYIIEDTELLALLATL